MSCPRNISIIKLFIGLVYEEWYYHHKITIPPVLLGGIYSLAARSRNPIDKWSKEGEAWAKWREVVMVGVEESQKAVACLSGTECDTHRALQQRFESRRGRPRMSIDQELEFGRRACRGLWRAERPPFGSCGECNA